MPSFSAPDGTRLSYRVLPGPAAPVICLAGGPMQDSRYLGTLGGLPAHRQLAVLDARGTGRSAVPADGSSYRCDRLVDDVEALRAHLGLERTDLLGHSAGANLALLYAARHPTRVERLALVTPSVRAVDVSVSGEARRATARLRDGEPWFPAAYAALEAVTEGRGGAADWAAIAPFFHGRWDAAAREFEATADQEKNHEAARAFGADGAFDPPATRAALGALRSRVLVLAGEVDPHLPPEVAETVAALFPVSTVVVQPGAGHYPWHDAPDRFTTAVGQFLTA